MCLSTLEITFRSISTTVNIKVLQQSLLKKISLISIENHNHIRYIEYMLKQIKMLILVKCDIDLRDIVLSFHKVSGERMEIYGELKNRIFSEIE